MEPGVHGADDDWWGGGAGGKKTGEAAGTLPRCLKTWDMTQYTCSTA